MPAQHSLKFVDNLHHLNEMETTAAIFRERGFVVVRDVFERDSVDAFEAEVRAALIRPTGPDGPAMLPDDSSLKIWPTRAPRLRAILDLVLSGDLMNPRTSMFECAWLVQKPTEKQVAPLDNWHKDRGHRGLALPGYQYPKDVHAAMYYCDMTPDLGPTQIIPRSHMDQTLSPYSGAAVESFLLRKQDAMIWDQRCWHRGTYRIVPGERINSIFGFYSVPVYHDGQHRMSRSQRNAWKEAQTPQDRVFYGGTFVAEGSDIKDPGSLG